MPEEAVSGHGALIAVELGSPPVAGVFTTIAELNGDITFPSLSHDETEVTPHQSTIDEWIASPVIKRGPLTWSVNFVHDNATHDHLTGILECAMDGVKRGFRLRGPGGTANTDEWIMSGFVQAFSEKSPVRTGVRTADITARMSGPMIIDGVIVS